MIISDCELHRASDVAVSQISGIDLDLNACINIAVRGQTWLKISLQKDLPGETVNRNPVCMTEQVIRWADVGKRRNSFGSG